MMPMQRPTTHTLLPHTPRPHQLLHIVKQTSPFEERVTKNGIQRDIHVVIKNSPFIVQLALVKNCEIDLNHVAFEAYLLYDCEGDKGVDFVKVKPIEYKSVPSDTGDQLAMELRIKVLTSQHEDMFFKVAIQGQDPISKIDIPNLRVVTAPIKVISKPEQLKKRQSSPSTTTSSSTQNNALCNNNNASNSSCSNNNNNSKKRTVNDMVVEAVTRIEKQQAEQAMMMERLLQELAPNMSKRMCVGDSISVGGVTVPPTGSWEIPLARPTQPKEDVDFETSFVQLLKSFSAVDPNHRADKVRRIARSLSVTDNECFSELVDMLTSEGLGQERVRETRPPAVNNTMYEKIDNIFFTSMMPPYGVNMNMNNMNMNMGAGSVLTHTHTGMPGSVGGVGGLEYGDFLSGLNTPNNEFLM